VNRRTLTKWLPLAVVATLLAAPRALAGDPLGWLPESASPEADDVDFLINFVTLITGITMVGVLGIMVLFLFKYRAKPGVKAKHTHGNHTVEMIWTIAPALILVFLALYQLDLWDRIKSPATADLGEPVPVQIFAKQFEWNFRYPGPAGKVHTKDDIYTVKQLVVPVNRPITAELRPMDVLHSFFLPNMRLKQDAVPGNPMKIWFRSNKLSKDRQPLPTLDGGTKQVAYWDIVCAELCGNLHTTMGGKLWVVTEDQYTRWLAGEKGIVPVTPVAVYWDGDEIAMSNIWSRWPWQDAKNTVSGPPAWKRRPFGEDLKPDLGGDEEEEL